MSKFRYLSYPLSQVVPAYGCEHVELTLKQIKSIRQGDPCNTFWLGLENHFGTHVDAPAHFYADGMTIAEYFPETWFSHRPCVIRIEVKENELIGIDSLAGHIPETADMVLVQSGFHRFRGTEKYTCHNPGLKPEVGIWLREKYPSVRLVGFDFISLSSFQNRNLGREAHRAFLDPHGVGVPILIIEDMDLSCELSGLLSVWVVPLRVVGLDSAPCTVIGVFHD
jgi:kynurenine formamidase